MKAQNSSHMPVQGKSILRKRALSFFHLDTEQQRNEAGYCMNLFHSGQSSQCLSAKALW